MSSKPTYEELEKRIQVLEKAESERKKTEETLRLNEARLTTQLKLSRMNKASLHEISEFVLDEAISLTGSNVGYIGFLNDDETVLSMYSWSRQVLESCAIEDKTLVHPITTKNLWGELVRRSCPIVVNDADNDTTAVKNFPKGHLILKRHLSLPVLDGERTVAVVVVGNKKSAYDKSDIRQLTLLMQGMWRIVKRQRTKAALKESKEKRLRSKKMESLGLFAGGIAHDLNNILSGIIGYPEIILMDLPKDSNLRRPVELIQDCGRRAIDTVQDLLTIARSAAVAKEPLDLNDMVDAFLGSAEFMQLEKRHPAVHVDIDLGQGLANLGGSKAHLKKVIANLMTNAFEAVSGKGHVSLSTANRYVDHPIKGYDDVIVGEYVVLSVSDNGSGISSDDLERIFEPFYTKKFLNRKSTGLGLAVVWNVVQEHNGYIDVSAKETGTTFELYFPTTKDDIWKKEEPLPLQQLKGHGEKVLVVDDEAHQRELLCKMSAMIGYDAKAVSSGEEAVAYMKDNTADLILLDMIMEPGLNGRQTYEKILEIHPGQKAIIVSGYAETEEVKKARQLGAVQYIRKPVELDKLLRAMNMELGRKLS